MPNRWIVSHYKFFEHETPEAAQAERERLAAATGKSFHIYRIKTDLAPDTGEAEGERG